MSEKEAQEMLLELKEKAELMVDLAYSSIIYNNKELAEEVYELENLVDELNEELKKTCGKRCYKRRIGCKRGPCNYPTW